ncbi:NAD-dependent epimerase/dehydratase family protein [Pendulispora albinea]|uniref:NAD(P)-dependent oxidoreductase n=1 Tax=Pendulispora albinea TaxID=2741071 RepID=A0ABZ2LVT6_9BACT
MLGSRTYNHPVVVTGGAGFLGTELVKQLLEAGCPDVRVVDLHPYPEGSDRVRSFSLDIRSGELHAAFAGAKTVLHLAACQYHSPLAKTTYRLPFFGVNVDGTRRLLAAAEEHDLERFVFVSTNMVYGLPQSLPLREDHPKIPIGPYGHSKLEAEKYVEQAHGRKLDTAIVRPGLIVGPGRIGVIARVFDWILGNKPVVLIGRGDNRYELTSSFDVASLVFKAGLARGHAVYNTSSANVPTMREWISHVIEHAGSRSRIIGIPGQPLKLALQVLEKARISPLRGDQYEIADLDYYMDTTRARNELDWRPRFSGLEAVLDTFRWYTSAERKNAASHARATAR